MGKAFELRVRNRENLEIPFSGLFHFADLGGFLLDYQFLRISFRNAARLPACVSQSGSIPGAVDQRGGGQLQRSLVYLTSC